MNAEEIQERIDYFESKVEAIEGELESLESSLMESDKMGLTSLSGLEKKWVIEKEAYLLYCQRRIKHYKETLIVRVKSN